MRSCHRGVRLISHVSWTQELRLANQLFRGRLVNSIRHALDEARTVGDVQHPGLIGRYRELLAANVLRPMLPVDYAIGSGKIVDSTGRMTSEIDLVIFHRNAIPPILWSDRDGVFPVESCLYAIEVKSRLTGAEIQDCIRKARLALLLKERHRSRGYELLKTELMFALFSFESDKANVAEEVQRYCQLDSSGLTEPAVNVICVAGKSYAYFDAMHNEWRGLAASTDHDEVIQFVAGVANTVLAASGIRAQGLGLGPYLMDDQASGVRQEAEARESDPVGTRYATVGRNDPCPCGSGGEREQVQEVPRPVGQLTLRWSRRRC